MYFNYVCHKCGAQNSWYIHPKNITEFYCKTCNEHIACSNCTTLKIINKDKFNYNQYSVEEYPENIKKKSNQYIFDTNATTHWYYSDSPSTDSW